MTQTLPAKVGRAVRALIRRQIRLEYDGIPFTMDLPRRKILNWILAEASATFQLAVPLGWPTHVQIEPSAYCNLRCSLCHLTRGLDRPQGNMTLETYQRTIDELGDHLLLALLWDWGEPFLNPKIYEMITYARDRGITTISSTNGIPFTKKERAENLVRSGLDCIIVAVDGISQETYRRYREGGELDEVVAGVQNIVAAKRAARSQKPMVNLRFIPMKHNEHEIPRLEAFARQLQVDAWTLKTLNPHPPAADDASIAYADAFIPSGPCYQRFQYDLGGRRIRRQMNPCKALWNSCTVHWDGSVSPCSEDPDGLNSFGKITEESFQAIWWGKAYRSFRRQLHSNYRAIPICEECSCAFEGGTLGAETVTKARLLSRE